MGPTCRACRRRRHGRQRQQQVECNANPLPWGVPNGHLHALMCVRVNNHIYKTEPVKWRVRYALGAAGCTPPLAGCAPGPRTRPNVPSPSLPLPDLPQVMGGQEALEKRLALVETHQKEIHDTLVAMEGEAERLYREERGLLDDDSRCIGGGGVWVCEVSVGMGRGGARYSVCCTRCRHGFVSAPWNMLRCTPAGLGLTAPHLI